MEDLQNLRKGVGSCEDEETETSQNVPLGTIDLGSFEVLADHGDAVEDEVDVDESTDETTEMIPPLPPASSLKKTSHRDEEYPFLDCWDWKHEQSDVLQHVDARARNAPKSVPNVKGFFSANFRARSVCQKLGVCTNDCQLKRHRVTSPVREKTDRATTPMMESGGLTTWT